jgi:hypothetical protein
MGFPLYVARRKEPVEPAQAGCAQIYFLQRAPTHELETKLSGSISRRPRLFPQRMSLSGRRLYFDRIGKRTRDAPTILNA